MKGKRIYGHHVNIDLTKCYYCKVSIDEFSRTKDHLIPESRGGIRANKNSVPACASCNQLKADMEPEEFLRAITSMIHLENRTHKKQTSYLTMIKKSLKKIITSKNAKNPT